AKQSPALVRINPKAAPKVSSQRQADAWPLVERGATALARHDYDRALTLYRQAYNTDPHNTYAQSGIAESLLLLRRYSEAEAAYRAILAVRPNDVKAPKGAGDALAYADHAAAALPFYQKAAALQPKSFDALYQLAQAYA